MDAGTLYWVLMLIWILVGLYVHYEEGKPYPFRLGSWTLLQFFLLLVLGWKVFGPPIR